jgi:hypothetical protein
VVYGLSGADVTKLPEYCVSLRCEAATSRSFEVASEQRRRAKWTESRCYMGLEIFAATGRPRTWPAATDAVGAMVFISADALNASRILRTGIETASDR